MKRHLLLLTLLATCTVSTNAQTQLAQDNTHGYAAFTLIPKAYTTDGKDYLGAAMSDGFYVMDMSTGSRSSYEVGGAAIDWSVYGYDSEKGVYNTNPSYTVKFNAGAIPVSISPGYGEGVAATQTLFNTDDKFEAVVVNTSSVNAEIHYGNEKYRLSGMVPSGLKIVNQSGSTIATLNGIVKEERKGDGTYRVYTAVPQLQVILVGDIQVLVMTQKQMFYDEYDPENNKVSFTIFSLNGEANSVQQITQFIGTANTATYNLSGQRVGDDFKGIIIRDGKKILRK